MHVYTCLCVCECIGTFFCVGMCVCVCALACVGVCVFEYVGTLACVGMCRGQILVSGCLSQPPFISRDNL